MQPTGREPQSAAEPQHAGRGRWLRFARSWPFRYVIVPFLVTRLVLTVVGWLALQSFQNLPASPTTWEIKQDGEVRPVTPNRTVGVLSVEVYPLVNMWSRWDAGWYHSIAEYGYHFSPGKQSNTAFFPLYPMLMRVAHLMVPGTTDLSWFIAGMIVSHAALLTALFYLVLLVRIDFDQATATRTALYVLVFPTTVFLSAVYSESLFMAATAAAFYYARKNRWLVAGICAGAATLTRSPGILLGLPLLLEYLQQRNYRWRDIRPNVLALGLMPLCLAGLMLYFYWRFGNLLATRDAQLAWGHGWGSLTWPWKPFIRFFEHAFVTNDMINVGFGALALSLTVFAAMKLRLSYGVYAVSCYLFVTAWGSLDSIPRYMLAIFPAFIGLALLGRNRGFDRAYLIAASGLGAFFMIRFTLWRWVA
ncbi:MAG: hypothetical protein AVDCRST_MAG42-1732 [uncultured Chthoniobacterales bacterium]|uniref:Glycosyltransferase RgtA/B/C/D-like domain-containing protein n=1 Tax=uncultured Chthoniobacterales bacterium TaxID=1836801 RepID=A0A6J4I4F8_9BACT|nr:MAG: hypothetical protein AVDCRST_MAG42-1732 [uncultured Chthoniobacterales bacterium]